MDAMQYLDLNQSVKWQMSVGGLAQSVECVVSNDEAPGSKPGFSTFIFYHITQGKNKHKKHTAPTIPVWSPTTVLGKPNPACLRSSDGIRNIQDGMIV